MGLYILLYSPYFFACYAGRCVPCLSLGAIYYYYYYYYYLSP